jgi:hypothetical protein
MPRAILKRDAEPLLSWAVAEGAEGAQRSAAVVILDDRARGERRQGV